MAPKKKVKKKAVGVDLDRARRVKEELETKRNKANFWKPQGKSLIRVLPPWTDEGENANWFAACVYMHWGIPPDADDEQQRGVICSAKHGGGKCYICEQVASLYDSNDPDDIESAKRIQAKARMFVNMIDLEDAKKEDGTTKVQLWSFPTTVYDSMLTFFTDGEYGDITDPDAGFNLKVRKKGTGMLTRYEITATRNSSSLEDEGLDKDATLEAMNDLDNLGTVHINYKVLSYSDQKKVFTGKLLTDEEDSPSKKKRLTSDDDDDEDEDDDDKPKKKSSSKKPVKKVVKKKRDEEEDEDEDDDEEDEDDDEEDEDDDEDEEEEEEEDEPVKKKASKKPATKKKKKVAKKKKDDDDDDDDFGVDIDDDEDEEDDDSEEIEKELKKSIAKSKKKR